MSFFDTILLVIMTVFVLNGLVKGLIRSVGSFVAVIAGIWAAIYFYAPFYGLLKNLFFGNSYLGYAISFLIVYIIVNRLVNFGFSVLNNTYDVISFIPFLKTINRLGGAVFGFVEGGLVLGLLLFIGLRYPGIKVILSRWTDSSEVTPFLISFAKIFIPLLPAVIGKIQSWYSSLKPDNFFPEVISNNPLINKWKQ